jgi:tRNA 5-methylaminomethyl-2-thiouridine biosynthesis bifunctional protein
MNAPEKAGSRAEVHLQLGFDGGRRFLARWRRWRDDSAASRRAVCHVAIARLADAAAAPADANAAKDALAQQLAAAWPPCVHGLHRLSFENGQVQLLLAVGDPRRWLTQLRLHTDSVSLIDIDRLVTAASDLPPLARALARLCRHGAALHGMPASIGASSAFASAGFECSPFVAGEPMRGRFAPRFEVRRPASPAEPTDGAREAVIVGAGLAGCALAWALAEHGWRTLLIDRQAGPAQEASGNPAGMFCGIVHPHDGSHARWQRAAALEAQRAVRFAIDHHAVAGATDGVVRLDRSGRTREQMHDILQQLALPGDFVQALDAGEASERCGIELRHPAWFFAGGGWVQPGGLARSMLRRAGPMARLLDSRSARAVLNVQGRWQVLDDDGALIAEAPTLVLANAADALRLLQAHGVPTWPVDRVRGQLSLYGGATAPRLPLAGGSYWLPATGGVSTFGATAQVADLDPAVRADDHAHNLRRLHALSPLAPALAIGELQGRVAWRCVAADRLPMIGAVPDPRALPGGRLQHLPRLPGLHVLTALGSRGIASAVLGGQVLAAQISGAAMPLEVKLLDAIDPGRFAMRAARRR